MRWNPESAVPLNRLLDNVTVYWVTAPPRRPPACPGRASRVWQEATETLPTGVPGFPRDLLKPPRAWYETNFKPPHWTTLPRGGHFAAFEQPELFVDDVRVFFAMIR